MLKLLIMFLYLKFFFIFVYVKQLNIYSMAKINDLKKLIVIDEVYHHVDCLGRPFFNPCQLCNFRIQFGLENSKTGNGSVKVVAEIFLHSKKYTYTFFGTYCHVSDYAIFTSIQVDREFDCSFLLSVVQYKIRRSWDLEEEEEGVEGAPAIASVEAVEDGKIDHSKITLPL